MCERESKILPRGECDGQVRGSDCLVDWPRRRHLDDRLRDEPRYRKLLLLWCLDLQREHDSPVDYSKLVVRAGIHCGWSDSDGSGRKIIVGQS